MYLYPFICSKTCFYVSYTYTLLCHWLPKRLFLQLWQNVLCFDCFPGMTSSLAKCKQVFGHALLELLQQFAYLCDILQYANGLIVLKKDDRQFTLTSKKTLHLIFNVILLE